MTKFESEVQYVNNTQQAAYDKLADLRNLQALKDRIDDPAVQQKMAEQIPADKLEAAREQLRKMQFDADSVQLDSPVGHVTLRIIERESPKLVKFVGEGSPLPIAVWVQLLPYGETQAKLRVTVGAEVNFFMKGMVSKPLQQAADGLASILAGALGA